MGYGDHIKVQRWLGIYEHHGIEIEDEYVIHYTGEGESSEKTNAQIKKTTKYEFSNDSDIKIVQYSYEESLPSEEVVRRAKSKLGEQHYNLLFNNCEAFAMWCKTGDKSSKQVDNIVSPIFSRGGGVAGAAVGTAIATSSVTVLGSSTLGSVALTLGLVSAPVAPAIIGGAIGSVIGFGLWNGIKKLF